MSINREFWDLSWDIKCPIIMHEYIWESMSHSCILRIALRVPDLMLTPYCSLAFTPCIYVMLINKVDNQINSRDICVVICPLSKIYIVNPLPDMPILSSSNSAANKDMMSKILTDRETTF